MTTKGAVYKYSKPTLSKRMENARDLYVKQLRMQAQGLLKDAGILEKNCLEDADDLKSIKDLLPWIEERGTEVNDLWEDISVLAQDLKEYIDPDLTDAEREKFGF